MKNRKRLIAYSLLALPFVVFGLFFLTLDPVARSGFFGELRANTAEQFGMTDEIPAVNSGAAPVPVATGDGSPSDSGSQEADSSGGGRSEGRGGRGRGGGGFDPADLFAERDADGDGKLTGDEIGERMRENLDRIDQDQDGAITLEEMQAGFGRRRGGRGGGRGEGGGREAGGGSFGPAQLFSRRDEDGDGKLTGDEIGERMREYVADIDSDGDGSLSLEEVQNGWEELTANFRSGGGRGQRSNDAADDAAGSNRPQRPE